MNRYSLICATVLVATSTPAFAEDGDWSGLYGGVNIGFNKTKSATDAALSGSWTAESQIVRDHVTNNFAANQSVKDVSYGGQIGYNYQTGGAVLGVEADFNFLSGSEISSRGPLAPSSNPGLTYTFTNRIDPKNMVSVKAKLGAALGSTLIYAEGGWAFTKARFGADLASNGNYSKSGRLSETMDGFIIGGGIEHKISDNVSARLSYDYSDQGSATYVAAYNAGSAYGPPRYNYVETFRQDLKLHLIRVGVNFHI